jgi:hypothetical protein
LSDKLIRRSLQFSVVFNLGGAWMFAFPALPVGQIAGLPASVPGLYRAMLALFITLFAGAYAWLSVQPDIDRPLVAFSAIGKACAFATFVAFWIVGQVPGRGVIMVSGDLILAAVFAWWLIAASNEVSARPPDALVKMPTR